MARFGFKQTFVHQIRWTDTIKNQTTTKRQLSCLFQFTHALCHLQFLKLSGNSESEHFSYMLSSSPLTGKASLAAAHTTCRKVKACSGRSSHSATKLKPFSKASTGLKSEYKSFQCINSILFKDILFSRNRARASFFLKSQFYLQSPTVQR